MISSHLFIPTLFALAVTAAPAFAAVRYVARNGSDATNDCSVAATPCADIAYAVTQAATGDEVHVAAGAYNTNGMIDVTDGRSIAVLGGWSADFTTRDPVARPTKVKFSARYQSTVRGFARLSAGALTLDGLSVVLSGGTSGVEVSGTSDLTVRGCSFSQGSVHIRASNEGAIDIEDSTFSKTQDVLAWEVHAGSTSSFSLRRSRVLGTRHAHFALGRVVELLVSGNLVADIRDVVFNRNGSEEPPLKVRTSGTATLSMTVVNTHITKNRAEFSGAGLFVYTSGQSTAQVDVLDSSITANRAIKNQQGAGGVVMIADAPASSLTVAFRNTAIVGNASSEGPDDLLLEQRFGGTLTASADHALTGDVQLNGGVVLQDLGGNLSATTPQLKVDKSGAARPLPASLALDSASCAIAPPLDFEGDARPSGAGCDIGADEAVP